MTADGARPPLARVGDVIEHGQDIPANVVLMSHINNGGVPTVTRVRRILETGLSRYWTGGRMQTWDDGQIPRHLYPLTVIEVDPEPQPGESGPPVLTLPDVPKGAVALVGGRTGQRFTVDPEATGRAVWTNGSLSRWTLANLLDQEQPEGVTVEFAPPREPRTWGQIDGTVEGLLPAVVSVRRESGTSVWTLEASGSYRREGDHDVPPLSLLELRTLGKVTEVFGDA